MLFSLQFGGQWFESSCYVSNWVFTSFLGGSHPHVPTTKSHQFSSKLTVSCPYPLIFTEHSCLPVTGPGPWGAGVQAVLCIPTGVSTPSTKEFLGLLHLHAWRMGRAALCWQPGPRRPGSSSSEWSGLLGYLLAKVFSARNNYPSISFTRKAWQCNFRLIIKTIWQKPRPLGTNFQYSLQDNDFPTALTYAE